MNRKIVWLAFVSVLLVSTVFGMIWSSGFVTTASPRTWTVGPEGPPKYDFANVQPAIDSAKDGDTILVAAGTYHEFIIIDKSLNLVGVDGSDATIIDAEENDTDAVVTVESSDVRVENFTIEHAGWHWGSGYYGTGIRIRNDQKSIDGIVIHKNKILFNDIGIDAGFVLGAGSAYSLSDSNITENTIFRQITSGGIFLYNVTNLWICNNTMRDIGVAIHLVGVYKTEILGNNAYSLTCNFLDIMHPAGLELQEAYLNNIIGNTMTEIENCSINVGGSCNTISNNTVTGVYGISTDGDYNNITGNTIRDINETGIMEIGSYNNIDYNNIMGASGHASGISMNGNFSSIYQNTITAAVARGNNVGISVAGFSNNISSNDITYNWSQGISAEESSNNIINNTIQRVDTGVWGGACISGNNKIQNCATGVYIPFTRENVSVNNNFFQDCGLGVGVGGNSTNIASNTFLSCPYGVHAMKGTSTNVIYHNMFLNSSAADDSEGFGNSWDMGNVIGGNYWYDYEGEDFNGDGFGDTPYIIKNKYGNETTNSDNYPLIVPRAPIPVFWKEKVKGEIQSYCYVHSNMTVSRFHLDEKTKIISFNVTGRGYCNLTIPRDVLDGSFKIFINNTQVSCLSSWTETNTSVYFDYKTSIPLSVKIEAQVKLVCDLNGDGKINILDIALVAKQYGRELIYP
jgi:parallel beta-helix repeat protein